MALANVEAFIQPCMHKYSPMNCLSALPLEGDMDESAAAADDLVLRMDLGLCAADGVCGPARFGSNLVC